MANTSNELLESMQSRFPHIFSVYDDSTILYTLLSIYAGRFSDRTEYIDRLDAMIGINTTQDQDLEHRWGSLLSVYRLNGETYNEYRSRLKVAYSSLGGGTADTIKYAVASGIGVNGNSELVDTYIKIFDGWDYLVNGEPMPDMVYGHFICEIDIRIQNGVTDMKDLIMSIVDKCKASGTTPHIIFLSKSIKTYNDLGVLTYASLNGMKYEEIGGTD